MKKRTIIITSIVIFIGIFTYASLKNVEPLEIENAPNWLTLDEAQKLAKETDKLIMVDVYEVGCKYCRAMEREVYPDTTVRTVLDQGYLPVKINGNSTELIKFNGEEITERDFSQDKGAFVFPTVLILSAEGDLLKKRTGYMNIDELRQFLYNPRS